MCLQTNTQNWLTALPYKCLSIKDHCERLPSWNPTCKAKGDKKRVKIFFGSAVRGDRGVWNSPLSYLLLLRPAPFCRGSHLFVLFLLWNVAQYGKTFLFFSQFLPLWVCRFPPFLLPPLLPLVPPILLGTRLVPFRSAVISWERDQCRARSDNYL